MNPVRCPLCDQPIFDLAGLLAGRPLPPPETVEAVVYRAQQAHLAARCPQLPGGPS